MASLAPPVLMAALPVLPSCWSFRVSYTIWITGILKAWGWQVLINKKNTCKLQMWSCILKLRDCQVLTPVLPLPVSAAYKKQKKRKWDIYPPIHPCTFSIQGKQKQRPTISTSPPPRIRGIDSAWMSVGSLKPSDWHKSAQWQQIKTT